MVAPKGRWRLPPQQKVLQLGDTPFDLDRVAQELTVIISTSVADFIPSTDTPLAALESLQSNIALRWCRKLLVFDKVPSCEEIDEMRRDSKTWYHVARGAKWMNTWNSKRKDYNEYCATMVAMKSANHPALFNVDLIFLPRFGHLFGTVKEAFKYLGREARYIFATQHDLRLSGKFVAADVQRVLETLECRKARYIVLNRDVNSAARTQVYFKLLPQHSLQDDAKQPMGISLTAVAGFSDQAHFAEVEWYKHEVVDAIRPEEQLTCMEHVLHAPWKEAEEWKGTFLYGGLHDGPFVLDLVYGAQVYDHEGRLSKLPPPPSRPAG